MSKAKPKRKAIPYYQLRYAVEQAYGRRRILWQSITWGVGFGSVGGIWYFFSTPIPTILTVIGIAVLLTLVVLITMFLINLIGDTLSLSTKEEELVEKCIEQLEPWADDVITRKAIREMAARPADSIQVRSLLAVVILTIASTVVVQLSFPAAFILGGLALLALLSVVIVIGHGHADMVIQNALTEYERRLELAQARMAPEVAATASSTLLPAAPQITARQEQPTPASAFLLPTHPALPAAPTVEAAL